MIIQIPEDIKSEFDEVENQLIDFRIARKVLEKALHFQFSSLADQLLAHLILTGEKITDEQWWIHYITQSGSPKNYQFDDKNLAILTAFKNEFIENVKSLRIKPIRPSDFHKIQIRVYGGHIKLWDDVKLNDQLASLGSSHRFIFVGSRDVATNDLLSSLEFDINAKIDGRFIYGSVGAISTCPVAPIYDFVHELAVSPYLRPNAPAFIFENRIVIRQPVLKTTSPMPKKTNFISKLKKDKRDEEFHALWKHTLTHEAIHISQSFHGPDNFLYYKINWLDHTKQDICRYLQSPRTFSEISKTFEGNFNTTMNIFKFANEKTGWKMGQEMIDFVDKHSLEIILNQLRAEKFINIDLQGKYYCSIYESGKKWKID